MARRSALFAQDDTLRCQTFAGVILVIFSMLGSRAEFLHAPRDTSGIVMDFRSLGYFGIGASDLDGWRQFGTGLVGLQAVETSRSLLSFRMDDRKQRIVIDRSLPEGSRLFGWELDDADALDRLGSHLEQHGVAVKREPSNLADARFVAGLISFDDPAGNRIEAFYGPHIDVSPFRPGRSISGFRTGPLGLGHAVLTVERIDAVMPFYTDVLGFKLTDYILAPFKAFFLHVNPRHHSLALIETGRDAMHHLMVELFSLDDVGQAYDIALTQPDRIGVTLGRHTNDFMTSFYAKTPSAFMVECGWGGRVIEPARWQPREYTDGPSIWGHERNWLPQADRDRAREMRMRAAAEGLRQPVQVIEGNYQRMAGSCPWWDSVAHATGRSALQAAERDGALAPDV
jgi:2,3-dihydroxybiphenyl 1,2-dioxygenase